MTFYNQEIENTLKYKPKFEEYINILNMLKDTQQKKQFYQKQLIYNKKDFKRSDLLRHYNEKSKRYFKQFFYIIFTILEIILFVETLMNTDMGIITLIFLFVLMTVFFFVSSVILSFITSITLKHFKKKTLYINALNNNSNIEQHIAELQSQEDTLQEQERYLEKVLSDSEVPLNYWIYGREIITLLENKRANSITEAINLLEDIMHKIRMEIAAKNNIEAINNLTIQTQMVRDSINRIYIPREVSVRVIK